MMNANPLRPILVRVNPRQQPSCAARRGTGISKDFFVGLGMVMLAVAIWGVLGVPRGAAQDTTTSLEQQALLSAAQRAASSVVQIQPLGRLERTEEGLVGLGPTTGLVIEPEGFILTSAYTLAGDPNSLLVTLQDGTRLPARVVARDHSRALVLLKIEPESPLPVLPVAPLDELSPGQWAIAVGKGFSESQVNVSVGIISALNRIWGKALQTDAKVSPSNYGGPLLDLYGRVIGLLVPLSPHDESGLGGLEWYDSGIGFAVPLESWMPRLQTLKDGKDLHRGLLGVSMASSDLYGSAAKIDACHPKSPADEAGLEPGDEVIEINGTPIARQVDLKHALGPLYAGDSVRLRVKRGDEELEFEAELAEELIPYAHAFLGILPQRLLEQESVTIRYVYPGSPAAEAGLRPGDRIVEFGGEAIATADQLRAKLGQFVPGDTAALAIVAAAENGEEAERRELQVTLAEMPEIVPDDIPAVDVPPPDQPVEVATGETSLKMPEETAEIPLFVPPGLNPSYGYGLLVVLQSPGEKGSEGIAAWRDACQQHHAILAVPPSTEEGRWSPTDADFLAKVIVELTKTYPVDRSRIVVMGTGGGAPMAYVMAFVQRELVRGVVPVDVVLPRGLPIPDNLPLRRLALCMVYSEGKSEKELIVRNVQRFREARFPVTELLLPGDSGQWDPQAKEGLGRWFGSLDRL